jgi:hypothetical protein
MTLIEAARKDLGKKEKPGNLGFEDKELEKKMREVKWQPGWSWCSNILEKWFRDAYPERAQEMDGYFVPSATATFRNLKNAGYKVSMIPTVGALVFWQRMHDGVAQWQGHTGVVVEVYDDKHFLSIEGNASNSGSSNGDGVYEVKRKVKDVVNNGLRVLGFVSL